MSNTMTIHSALSLFATASFIMSLSSFHMTEASTNSFTIDLIHRDSPQSPYYDPSLTPSERMTNALQRSSSRIHRFRENYATNSPFADIVASNGEFLIKYAIGTPPVPALAILDTGSDLIWTQCQPCTECFKQKLPIFRPNASSSYKTLPCNSPSCYSLPDSSCNKKQRTCQYYDVYGDGSFTRGNGAKDTITLQSTTGQSVSFPDVSFGCGHENGGIFLGGESGIAGLGGGNASLASQLGPSIKGKFSYCLASFLSKTASKLNFGDNAVISGKGVVSTPVAPKDPKTFYYLTLEGITVDNERLENFGSTDANSRTIREGNIIIDSGTTLTILEQNLYNKLEKAVASKIKLKRIKDPKRLLHLCYFTKQDIQVPDIIVHFKGADVKLKAENTFTRTSNYSVCMAFLPTDDIPIYGYLAQINYVVEYDLQKKMLSFKPTDCSKS